MPFTHYHRPPNLDDACHLLEKLGKSAAPLAGGTSLTLRRSGATEHIVDLCDLSLGTVRGLDVGAMVTLSDLARSRTGHPSLRLLQTAANSVASKLLRNRITLGGSMASCFRWCDLAGPLVALDAQVVLETVDGLRFVGATEFFRMHPRRQIRRSELLTRVQLPDDVQAFAFRKMRLTTFSYGIWNAVVVIRGQGRSKRFSVAVSLGTALPKRLHRVEEALDREGPALSLSSLEQLVTGEVEQGGLRITSSWGFPGSYRRRVLPVLLADLLGDLQSQSNTKIAVGGAS